MPNSKRHRPTQRMNPIVKILFDKIDGTPNSPQIKDMLKKATIDQMVRRGESIILQEEEEIPEPDP